MTAHPSLPGDLGGAEVGDSAQEWRVASRTSHYESPYLSVGVDVIVAPDGSEHGRVVVRPHGAVGVLALDDADRVLLVEQYRHAQRQRMVELPAGTLDVEGEEPLEAARRELGEEADLAAADWSTLLTLAATPGYSSERWTVYRATGLSVLPTHEREAEEADMQQWWVPFETALEAALTGRIADAMTVAGLLAESARRR